MQYFYDKNKFFILPIAYLPPDSSNNIPEIYAFKSVENEKSKSTSQSICRTYRCELSFIYRLRLVKQEVQSKGGGFDMCKAIKEMLRVSRQEGRVEGQDEMATLSEKLILADRISELLKCRTVIHLVFCDLSCYYKSVSIF